jgi:phytoene dehydrogenase-like protein
MNQDYDAIIIGGGHNGLTAAGYLARAGLKPVVLERRHVVGGAAVTEEIHPGYRISTISYSISLLRPEVVRDLELKQHGFEMIHLDGSLTICGDDYLFFCGDEEHDRKEVERFSSVDYDAMTRFDAMVQEVGQVVRNQMLREPPKLDAGLSDLAALARMGLDIRRLSPDLRHRLLLMLTGSVYDLVHRWFESPMIRSMYAASSVSSNFASFRQAGSAIPFFHLALGEVDGEKGAWRAVKGGMGGITQAMASFAQSKGAEIRTGSPVEKILVERGRAVGVQLESGEIVNGRCVLANTDPKRTFLKLLDPEHLDPEFVEDIRQFRMGHHVFRINLALKGLPDIRFFAPGEEGPWHRSYIEVFRDLEELESNFHAALAGRFTKTPRLEISLPSTVDDSLAPAGHHVMAVVAKYYPFHLADGSSWDDIKEDVANDIIDDLARSMPNLPELIVGRHVLSPLDLETIYGLTECDVLHGHMDLGQIFSLRPHPKAAQYRTPVQGLYLCGSGAHPGGGVSGAPGHNAARRVMADLKRR